MRLSNAYGLPSSDWLIDWSIWFIHVLAFALPVLNGLVSYFLISNKSDAILLQIWIVYFTSLILMEGGTASTEALWKRSQPTTATVMLPHWSTETIPRSLRPIPWHSPTDSLHPQSPFSAWTWPCRFWTISLADETQVGYFGVILPSLRNRKWFCLLFSFVFEETFSIDSSHGKIGNLTLTKTRFRLGEDIHGRFDFSDRSVTCVEASFYLLFFTALK